MNKISSYVLLAALAVGASACSKHDLIPEITTVGQAVPTVYWEVGSTVCKAGDSFTFQGKYTSPEGRTPIRSEVWYQIVRDDVASVSTALAGTALAYTQTVSRTDTMRSFQCHAVFAHDQATWNGHEYIIQGTVPTSRTLSPVSWVEATEWDAERFNNFYPEGFQQTYLTKVINFLTSAETADSYYNALRNVYINYAFTNEQFKAAGLPEIDTTGDDGGAALKSDAWFSTTVDTEDARTGWYYTTLDAAGKVVYNEVKDKSQAPEGVRLYPTFKSAAWVFCRYDDNSGSIRSTVRPEYLPKFREMLETIPFQAWIYDSANSVYKVDFSRAYSLRANFRAYDKDTNRLNDPTAPVYEGVTSATDLKTITIN